MASDLLTWLVVLPLIGAALIMFASHGGAEERANAARYIALATTIVTFAVSLILWLKFDSSSAEFQFVRDVPWLPGFNISYHVGVDGISLFMVLLTTFLMPLCILCSWEAITTRVREYMICFLVLE